MRLTMIAALAALMVSGCGGSSQGETYPIATAQVREALLGTDAPIQVLGSQAVDWRTSQRGDDTVVWTVVGETDQQLVRFSAKVVPVDQNSTRVDVEVLPPEGKMNERVAKGLAENESVRNLYHLAMTEEIDAKLENRTFDYSRIAAATTRAVAANMKSITGSLDKAVEASRKREAENVERAYREERRNMKFGDYGHDDTQGKPFGAPMDNPGVN